MNGINNLGNGRGFSNTSTTTSLVGHPNNSTSTPLTDSRNREPAIGDSTIAISDEARLLSQSGKNTATTGKGHLLPDYLQPPPEGYTPDPSATSGSTFHFLTPSDREKIYAAFDYAVENDLDTEEVGLAAFYLSNERHVEAMVASGVKCVVYEPELEGGNVASESNSSVLNSSREALTDKAVSGELFSKNPLLNQSLFITVLFKALRLSPEAIENRLASISVADQ